jgi:transcriptional regulator with XRE-family HTH domain
LSQLRSGNRTNPSSTTMSALANFFRIKPAYFTDDDYYEKLDKELSWLTVMRDEGIRRIAMAASELSAEAREDVAHRVEELRRKENLDA